MRIWRYSWQGRVATVYPTEVADGAARMTGAEKGSYEGGRVGELGDSLYSILSRCVGSPWYVSNDWRARVQSGSRNKDIRRAPKMSCKWPSGMVAGIGLREGLCWRGAEGKKPLPGGGGLNLRRLRVRKLISSCCVVQARTGSILSSHCSSRPYRHRFAVAHSWA